MLVALGVLKFSYTLKLRTTPAASTWNARSRNFQSNAVFATKSGCRFGVNAFELLLVALVLPLPLSNCPGKMPAVPPGKTTDPGTNCCGFSSEAPNVPQSFA